MSDLRIYDIELDDYRPATQKDIDNFSSLFRAYGKIRAAVKEAQEELIEAMRKEPT